MKLTLGFSPCPNDTFIFDALVHNKIDTQGLDFKVIMRDVEELNEKALKGELDITKLSYHAYVYCSEHYILLNAGSALGNNCGPLLIAKEPKDHQAVNASKVAIPGKMTTANFLFSLEYPDVKNKEAILFSEIEPGVLNDQFDAGVIIHENRFTYAEKGLVKICDLGEQWEQKTGYPIPLGGIAISRNLPLEVQIKVDRLIKESIEYAFKNPASPKEYICQHAQEMDEAVMYQHINLYVNDYSINLGEKGRAAINHMYQKGVELKIFEPPKAPYILSDK